MARKKQAELSANDILKQLYPDIPSSDDFEPPAVEKQTQQAASEADRKTILDLQAQIANLTGQMSNVAKTNTALMTQATTDMPPTAPQADYSKAPNPIDDPAGYAKFVQKAVADQVEYEKQAYAWQTRQESSRANRASNLWATFTEQHPDYAENTERVEVAAMKVIERAKANGVDTDKYMYQNSGQFMADVTKEIDRLWGKPNAGGSADDGEGDTIEDIRTGGLQGGVQASNGGVRTAPAAPQRYGALSQDVIEWQKQTGFYR